MCTGYKVLVMSYNGLSSAVSMRVIKDNTKEK